MHHSDALLYSPIPPAVSSGLSKLLCESAVTNDTYVEAVVRESTRLESRVQDVRSSIREGSDSRLQWA